MDPGCKKEKKINPRETANLFSLLSFFYTLGLFKKGYKKDLEEVDLYEVLSSCRSKKLGDQIERQWEIERKTNKNPSLCRVLWKCYGKRYMVFGLIQLIMKTILVLLIPEAMGKLISYSTPGQNQLTIEDACYYTSIVIGFHLINCIYTQNYMIALIELGLSVRASICSLIYRKSLKLSATSLSDISMGRIVTLITKDADAFELFVYFANDIWIGFVQVCVVCYLIYSKTGVAAFCGVGVFFIVLPLQMFIGKLSASYRLETCKKTDERLQMTQETLSAIKIIKMYSWEKFFHSKVSRTRTKEVNAVHKLFYMKIFIVIIGGLSDKIAFYLLIMSYVWLGNNITAEIVYFLVSCFQKLADLVSFMIPMGISQTAELYAAFTRIRTLLETEDLLQPLPIENSNPTILPKIILDKVTVNIRGIDIFQNTSLVIEKGLNIIVGHVGSGKTSLLKAILQEYSIEGNLWIYGRISYASQEPWLFPSTIKQNILFGEKFDESRYKEVLRLCDLSYDLKRLAEGAQTIVGDRGLNLSKGQQARINLARAIYKDSDIYLLDDCLAALDHSVSDYIFRECIKKFLKHKLCVFVTHNTNQIREADNVIITRQGTFECIKPEDIAVKKIEENSYYEDEDSKLASEEKDEFVEKNIYHEKKKTGRVNFVTYKNYILFGGGFFVLSLVIILFIAAQTTISYTHKLVSNWVTLEQNVSDYKTQNITDTVEYNVISEKSSNVLILYTVMIILSTILSLMRSFAFFNFTRIASINIHKAMISKLINATMLFFDSHFIGNVLNRFSKDLFAIDEFLPFSAYECFDITFSMVGIIFLIVTVNTLFLIPATIFLVIAFLMRLFFQPTIRSVYRLHASTRSPVVGQINASLEGLTTIRAYKAQKLLIDEFDRHQDVYTSATYTWECTLRAMSFFLDSLCTMFIAIVVLRFLIVERDTTVGNIGLAISQAFQLTSLVQFSIRNLSICENHMSAVERALEYTQLEQESDKGDIAKDWPSKGEIKYENVSLLYNDKSESVLRNINFTIKSQEKIGIVGRTGAGKSSIISILFRLYEAKGTILIDGINIRTLSLNFLRSNIAIIPQDPILFCGTIRENIDPLKKFTDNEIWEILETIKLKGMIRNLDKTVSNSGADFSAGQKQLICLARAIVRKNIIVILDEVAANMDHETDSIILQTIKEKFLMCTVITIAHRLSSVLSSDKIIVIDKGKIVEFDEPKKLLENEKSVFNKIIKEF